MNYKFISLTLILLAPVPFYLSFFQFLNNGSIQWPMLWANETVFWGIIFSVFAIAGALIAFVKRARHPYFTFFAAIMAAIVLTLAVFFVLNGGLSQSSKADSTNLEPLQFWVSNWWQ